MLHTTKGHEGWAIPFVYRAERGGKKITDDDHGDHPIKNETINQSFRA